MPFRLAAYIFRTCAILAALAWGSGVASQTSTLPDYVIATFGAPPDVPTGPLVAPVQTAISTVVTQSLGQSSWDPSDTSALITIAGSGDPRLAWAFADMLRFSWQPDFRAALTDVAAQLLEIELKTIRHREEIIDHLIAWDVPAYPGYLDHKRTVFTNYVPGWEDIFTPGDIDWHLVSWGGVSIDDRPYNATDEVCHCIPAVDNPTVESAAAATWLQDDDIIFGIVINGEARAYPRRIMEVREMVNDTLGGRDLGIPYCTLCGAAQAFFTDDLPDGVQRPILRTSGLLIRSNKVMFDVKTNSVFDTFLGKAVTGPLAEIGLTLDQATIITSDWGSWKAAYPQTTVLTEDLALGRDYNLRETRDAFGPIFPIGDVDPRLPVHEDVIGVITSNGTPVAFPRAQAFAALQKSEAVRFETVQLVQDAGGIRAISAAGGDLGSHQAFWFAWSQFHPDTVLWPQ